jgi:hypothetical protein
MAAGCFSARSTPPWTRPIRPAPRPVRIVPRLPGRLPDRRLPRALPARCAALHFLSDHRTQRAGAGGIPRGLGNRIYGCDDCLAVCPWNKFAEVRAGAFAPRELVAPRLATLLALDDAGFRALFSGSPIKRIGRDRFVRNCLYAAGNSGNAACSRRSRRCWTIPIRWWPKRPGGP